MQKQNFKIKTKVKEPPQTLIYTKPFKFDTYDRKILSVLNKDARQSLADISKQVGLSRDAVRNRIVKLIEGKVIVNFKPILNSPAMGYPIINYVFIALHNPTAEQEEKFVKYMQSKKNITYVASLIGKWDFIIDIMAQNPGQFNEVMKDLRQNFSDLIKDYEIYGVLEEYKYEEISALVE
jgi:DNA-binding Lrp family transcriptional regulator